MFECLVKSTVPYQVFVPVEGLEACFAEHDSFVEEVDVGHAAFEQCSSLLVITGIVPTSASFLLSDSTAVA